MDAHNSAIAKAISEGALEWIEGTSLRPVEDDDEDEEEMVVRPAVGCSIAVKVC